MIDTSLDSTYMKRAIELAWRGQFTTHPNPNVGCVIVSTDGNIVGEGWHEKAGEPHAEVHALKMAGELAKDATVYVTLEPCSHQGKTGPCADALIKAGVGRVVVAMKDPYSEVSGRGIEKLKSAGIDVNVGVEEALSRALNPGFLQRCETGVPRVQLKLAASLDGRTALANGKSKWITGSEARADVHEGRALAGAILTGADTILADNPKLNVRPETDELVNLSAIRQPVRVIVDTQSRLIPGLQVFQDGVPIYLVRTQHSALSFPEHVTEWVVPELHEKADLSYVLEKISELGIHSVWVESGAKLAGAMIEADLVDELILYQAPKLLGDSAKPLVCLENIERMNNVRSLHLKSHQQLGADIKFIFEFEKSSQKEPS